VAGRPLTAVPHRDQAPSVGAGTDARVDRMGERASESDSTVETDLDRELDAISLNQALVDFEVANERVIDLTRRLMESYEEVRALRARVGELEAQHVELVQRQAAMEGSAAFRLASRIWNVRNAFGI